MDTTSALTKKAVRTWLTRCSSRSPGLPSVQIVAIPSWVDTLEHTSYPSRRATSVRPQRKGTSLRRLAVLATLHEKWLRESSAMIYKYEDLQSWRHCTRSDCVTQAPRSVK